MIGGAAGPEGHAAKTLECGTAATAQRKRHDSIVGWIRDDHFDIEPMDSEARCTPQSVAAHTLYENADPYLITEPDGVLDTSEAEYTAISDRAVRVHGSRYHQSETYTIKLEGATFGGYPTIIIAGVREPYIIRQLDDWLDGMRVKFADRVVEISGCAIAADDYTISVRVYGRDGVMGKLEPLRDQVGHEVGLLFTVTAAEETTCRTIAKSFAHFALHYPIPEWQGLISGLAFPFSPSDVYKGAVYHFNLNHVVVPDNPQEMFRTQIMEV